MFFCSFFVCAYNESAIFTFKMPCLSVFTARWACGQKQHGERGLVTARASRSCFFWARREYAKCDQSWWRIRHQAGGNTATTLVWYVVAPVPTFWTPAHGRAKCTLSVDGETGWYTGWYRAQCCVATKQSSHRVSRVVQRHPAQRRHVHVSKCRATGRKEAHGDKNMRARGQRHACVLQHTFSCTHAPCQNDNCFLCGCTKSAGPGCYGNGARTLIGG